MENHSPSSLTHSPYTGAVQGYIMSTVLGTGYTHNKNVLSETSEGL